YRTRRRAPVRPRPPRRSSELGAFAHHLHRAFVHLHQSLHQGQTDAESAMRLSDGAIDLGKHLEDGGEGLGWYAHAGIPHRYRDLDRKSTRLNSSHVRISYAVL